MKLRYKGNNLQSIEKTCIGVDTLEVFYVILLEQKMRNAKQY